MHSIAIEKKEGRFLPGLCSKRVCRQWCKNAVGQLGPVNPYLPACSKCTMVKKGGAKGIVLRVMRRSTAV